MSSSGLKPPKFGKGLMQGIYVPEFSPEDVDVANFIAEVEVEQEKTTKAVNAKVAKSSTPTTDIPVPITEAESQEIDRRIDAALKDIAERKEQVASIRKLLDAQVQPSTSAASGSSEYNFKLDISRKRRIKKAIKALFGIKTDTITYSMYKEMLAARAQLEQEEAEGYVSGYPDRDSSEPKKESYEEDGKKGKKKRPKKGFIERGVDEEDGDEEAELEEQYERLFAKMARDFVYKGDLENAIDQNISDTEAKRRALLYKDVIDSGTDGSKLFDDIIEMDPEE
jgi:ribosomal protein L23